MTKISEFTTQITGGLNSTDRFEVARSGEAVEFYATADDIKKYAITPGINAQIGTTYTLVLGDAGGLVTMSNAAANTLTIPTNASVDFPTGTVIEVWQFGAGATTVEADTGVTLNGVSAGSVVLGAAYAPATLRKIGTDAWIVAVVGAADVVA